MRSVKRAVSLLLAALLVFLTACGGETLSDGTGQAETGRYLTFVDEEPDTVDPQRTSEYYTVALNVFDRLVEVEVNDNGSTEIRPSLAESWEISDDGCTYTFFLHQGVKFSNGALLTASDVLYTFTRLLSLPDAASTDIAADIAGAAEFQAGRTQTLEGFHLLDDYTFSITMNQPYAAFLACLSTPGASILDEETTIEAGSLFGQSPEHTIGTGPFLFTSWAPGTELVLSANRECWSGPPRCDGLRVLFVSDPEAQRLLFEDGTLDILDLDNMGVEAEYFINGNQEQTIHGPRVGISYIALNQSIPPLDDLRVRRALQYGLDRQILLNAVFSGRGMVEHGIFPRGLIGHNADLLPIPYAPEEAARLLEEAGLSDGFNLEIAASDSSTVAMRELLELTASMWARLGVRANVVYLPEEEWLARRKSASLACYSSTWSADFNDPDNFIYTFFGTRENTNGRSLCYPDEAVMKRVRDARAVTDSGERISTYQALERIIVQEDASWIPLFSKEHYFALSRRVSGFQVSWNGWSNNRYRNVSVTE
ncbi:MAG: ABC transporter substrate-binding protein [Oscillibacter sp.]|nr:ABC transporter substrate-binding protein [Oscillibacter sp.]